MPLKKELKQEVMTKFQQHGTDTGSTSVQIALLTERINQIVDHLKKNKKDNHSRRGLLILVSQRKRLVTYLKRTDAPRFDEISTKLGVS
jgi:small subunit ribosomal protein S15